MFTLASRKLRLVLTSVASVALIYLGLNVCLLSLAEWAESRADTYPYRSEDWLRYLLPTMFENRSKNLLLLAGESAVREGLIYERFDRELANLRTLQGALSLGTLEDVLLSLDYMQKVYGDEALPEVLVLGITPRFVANIPGDRPLTMAIDRYSPFYRVEQTPNGSRLAPKTSWESVVSRARFFLKQQARYRAALIALLHYVLREDVPYEEFHEDFPKMRAVLGALSFRSADIMAALAFVREVGVKSALGRWFRVYTSPYKYHYLQPMRPEAIDGWLRDPRSFWVRVHSWDPEHNAGLVHLLFTRLLDFTKLHRIQLYVVNLPENELSRVLYLPEHYARYREVVVEALDNTPFLDLREMLTTEDFYDVVHPNLASALRVTDRVVKFISNHRNGVDQADGVVSLEHTLPNGRQAKRIGE